MPRMKIALACAAALAPIALTASTASASHEQQRRDPCFFTDTEFYQWWNGDRWGASLSKVEDNIANCTGTWDNDGVVVDDWFGHNVKARVWPMKNGDQVEIWFAHYDTTPTWRAHDRAWEGNVRYCEWPRPDGDGC